MNDPQVVALIYHIEHDNSVSYEKTRPLVRDEPEFRVKVKNKKVRFKLKKYYATEAEARGPIDEYIRVWELDAGLRRGPDFFKLKFDRAKIVDQNPPPDSVDSASIKWEFTIPPATVTIGPSNYPSPPSGLSIDPDVQTMYDRYMNHLRGYEPLQGMAYFCLTTLEYIAKTRKAAAQHFNISKRVLDKIGELSTKTGGRSEARKRDGVDRDPTEQERRFLEEAVKKMIYRAAEKIEVEKTNNPTKNLCQITLSDLPPP